MQEVIIVSGLMRSGTSFVARCLHDAGLPMGTLMAFPQSKTEPEYEDAVLAQMLAHRLVDGRRPTVAQLRAYVESRGPKRWGFKSPLLLPFLRECKQALVNRPMRLILTDRDFGDTLNSIERLAPSKTVKERMVAIQTVIRAAYDQEVADFLVDFKQIENEPERVRESLRAFLKE